MAKFVTAYDTRTGEELPHPVPKSWIDKGTFPHLSTSKPAKKADATVTKKEG
nr:hypothetical protein [uncultured Actinotalea sp.]